MKYFVLAIIVCTLLGCSTESLSPEKMNESIEEYSKTQRPQKAVPLKDILFIGVFGHNTDKSLHGKISIRKVNQSLYEADIKLLDGTFTSLYARKTDKNNQLFFEGENGSFTFSLSEEGNPIVTNVYVFGDTEGYVKLVEKSQTQTQIILLGTYAEDGNEANFYGNWDLIAIDQNALAPNKMPPQLALFTPTQAIISHGASATPFEDSVFEPYDDPSSCFYSEGEPIIVGVFSLDETTFYLNSVSLQNQNSIFAGQQANWQLYYDEISTPVYKNSNCEFADSGTWNWNGKSGSILFEGVMW